MNRQLMLAAAVLALAASPASAQQRNEVQGFGGVTVGTAAIGSAVSATFGGRIGVGLTPHIQAIGEAGRLAGIESPSFDVLDFADLTVGIAAFYGEGGVRVITAPGSAVRPYGEATAGFARLNASVSGLNGRTDPIIDAALGVINSTRPMFGAGAGVLIAAGPVAIDIGYRYKRISAGDTIATFLTGGSDFTINQVRVGVGVRF
jgi:opacity protein-like surface antigen